MIDTLFLSLLLSLGLSIRTPNVQPNPIDYEVSFGLESDFSNKGTIDGWVWYERENGFYYKGIDIVSKYYPISFLESGVFYIDRQAQSIYRFGGNVGLIFGKFFRSGVLQVWDKKIPVFAGYLGLKSKYINGKINLYDEGLEGGNVQIKIPIKYKSFMVTPLYNYRIDRSKNEYMQGKLVVSYLFKLKR